MQLGFTAWAMPAMPIEAQIALVRDAGYAGIELVSGMNSHWRAADLDAAARRQVRRWLDEAGLTLTALAGHSDLIAEDPEVRRAAAEHLRSVVDLAADLAGPKGPPPVVSIGFGEPGRYEQQRGAIRDAFGEMAEYAGARGGVIAFESHVGHAIDRPERVRWLLEQVGSPHLRLNFDNSHWEVMGYGLHDYVVPLLPHAVHTHLKDQRGRYPDHQFLVPGEGEFDYAAYFRSMTRHGYHGFVTVEVSMMVHGRPGYDPAEAARFAYRTLRGAADRAGVALGPG